MKKQETEKLGRMNNKEQLEEKTLSNQDKQGGKVGQTQKNIRKHKENI